MLPENDYGNVEYKLKLMDKTRDRLERLATQLRFRVEEGRGECIYHLGVANNGTILGISKDEYNETMNYIKNMVSFNKYMINTIHEKEVDKDKSIYELLIREINDSNYIDIKVTVAGSVDAGKSTLLGVLTSGQLDDGRGSARTRIFNYRHEIASGRTSSIAHHILGFDSKGIAISSEKVGKLTWPEIVKKSAKIISFNDLAGHEKYLKTTILGLSSSFPDVCLIIVGANMGLTRMTQEHIFLCLALKVPFIIVLTKLDIVKTRQNVYKETLDTLYKLLKFPSVRKIPYRVRDKDDLMVCVEKIYHDTITPIFEVSSVTGEGIENLKEFFNLLKKRNREYNNAENMEFHIDTIYKNIKGIGIVVGGNLMSGTVKVGDKVLIGPFGEDFEPCIIKSIQCKRVPLDKVDFATYVCLGLKGVDKDKLRKGNVIVSLNYNPVASLEFEADIKVLKSHSTTVKIGYEPIIHTSSIRQGANIVKIVEKDSDRNEEGNDNILRVGDRGKVIFRFKYRPEFIKVGYKLFLSEGKTKAVGEITKVLN